MIKVQFVKTHPDAKLPKFNNLDPLTGDAGADLYSVKSGIIPAKGSAVVDVGLKVGYIPPGWYFTIETRSGLGFKHELMCHRGIIDTMYRGNLSTLIYNHSDYHFEYEPGTRIAQICFHRLAQPEFDWIDEKDVVATARGEKGFGSSGK